MRNNSNPSVSENLTVTDSNTNGLSQRSQLKKTTTFIQHQRMAVLRSDQISNAKSFSITRAFSTSLSRQKELIFLIFRRRRGGRKRIACSVALVPGRSAQYGRLEIDWSLQSKMKEGYMICSTIGPYVQHQYPYTL